MKREGRCVLLSPALIAKLQVPYGAGKGAWSVTYLDRSGRRQGSGVEKLGRKPAYVRCPR